MMMFSCHIFFRFARGTISFGVFDFIIYNFIIYFHVYIICVVVFERY